MREFIDPREREAEEAFSVMISRFKAKSREEHIEEGVECGVLDSDGNPRAPEGEPCVSLPHREPRETKEGGMKELEWQLDLNAGRGEAVVDNIEWAVRRIENRWYATIKVLDVPESDTRCRLHIEGPFAPSPLNAVRALEEELMRLFGNLGRITLRWKMEKTQHKFLTPKERNEG